MTDVVVWIDTRNPRYAAWALLAAASLIEAEGAVPLVTYEVGAIKVGGRDG